MRSSQLRPRLHVYVCGNRRDADDPLGSGCGDDGEAVFSALKARTRSLDPRSVWVTRTQCLGLCPKRGCTVAVAPSMQYLVEVELDDVEPLVSALVNAAR
jgi:(2Fe-2S) ferredoxin